MKLQIQVKPNSRQESVQQQPDGSYKISLNAPPTEGRANERLVEVLADHFKVPKSRISILRGAKSRTKVVEVG
jgi:uncharacterized protein (TIGR00251 family)